MRTKRILGVVGLASVLGVSVAWATVQFEEPLKKLTRIWQARLDVPYVPTPQPVVDKMLEMAAVTEKDVVYDLGCGDGRIVVTAARKFGARGVGVDIDPERIKESNANAKEAGVTDRVTFMRQDLFKIDLREATVVTLYLLPEINLKLRPKLFKELAPGTRIVSHDFDMGDWKPERTETVNDQGIEHTLYYWTIPAKADQAASAES
jgi:SAM-dependent methyltransferase